MRGFSLIEMLVVVAMLAILAVFAIPAMQSIGAGQSLSRGGNILRDQIAMARQQSLARNRNIEVRIVELSEGGQNGFRGVQLWIESEDGATLTPLNRMETLPTGIAVSSNTRLSPLLEIDAKRQGTTNFPGHGTRPYKAFRIRASGSMDPLVTTNNNFLTVCHQRDEGIPPKNYSTLRINPVTARVSEYRP